MVEQLFCKQQVVGSNPTLGYNMTKLSEFDLEILERKNASREEDHKAVANGKSTWAEVNRANTFGASVIHLYRPLKKLRILFLDIDGVLNAHAYDLGAERGPQNLCPLMCARLERVLVATGCVIVLSSAWRYRTDLSLLESWLHERGAPSARIIDRTPVGEEMGYALGPIPNGGGARMWVGEDRGLEIQTWLNTHSVECFAVAEDSAILGALEAQCVRPKSNVGLEECHVAELIEALNS